MSATMEMVDRLPINAIASPPATSYTMAAGECYNDVADLIKITVRAFVKRHGGNYDDLLADANTAYMLGFDAYTHRHTNGRAIHANFENEIRRWVWFELFDNHRVRTQHRCKVKVVIANDEFIGERIDYRNHDMCRVVDLMESLSPDARQAAELVVNTPEELAHAARRRGGTDRNMRSVIRQHLAGLGWAPGRINAAFEEVAAALEH